MGNVTSNGRTSSTEAHTDALGYVCSIVDTVREPLLVLDGDLRVQSANRSFYRNFRVSPQATEGRFLYDLGNGQWNIPALHTLLEEILPRDNSFDDFEVEHDFPNIGRKVMLLNARRLRQEGTERILLAIEDVTERRRLEAERREIETRFTSLVKNVRDHSIFTLDPEGRVTSWNVAAEHILGYVEAEALGRHFAFIFTPEDREHGVPEAELRVAREQGRAEDERWHLRKGGERFWALGIVSALHDPDGRLTGFSKILRDMTAWKRSQEVMQASEQRLRMALDRIYTVSFEWDIRLNQVRRDHSFLGAVPETQAEQPGSLEDVVAAVHPDDRERFLANLHGALADPDGGYRSEFRVCEPDGRIVWLAEHGYLECDEQGQPQRLIGLSRDITERKDAEAERERLLQEVQIERDRLSALLASMRDEVWFADRQRQFTLANPAAQNQFGLPPGAPVDIENLVARLNVLRADGSPRAIEASPALRALHGESVSNEEEIVRIPASGELRYREVSATPVRGPDGQIIGSVSVVRDITERKQAELALRESDRRKDVFLAILAHELRNPLAPIRTGLELIDALRGDAAACEEPLRIMERQVSHLVRLIDDLLDVSRISRGKIRLRRERLELAEIIEAALDMSESNQVDQGDRHVSVDVPSESLPVEGDRVRLVQVLANLLNNAAKFTDAGGHIDLRVTRKGDRVEIRVEDDGQGIPPDRLDEIFEMFSQAEPGHGPGLGIGLSLVRGLVEMHGGTVGAESAGPGRGAAFTVSLPLCTGVTASPTADRVAEPGPLPAGCRVLVVDDNRDIVKGLHLLLTTLGAEVRVAHDGAEALRVFADWPATHVLMDLGMPGMDGYEAARRLRAQHPGAAFRLVAVTGWGQEEDRQRAREAGFDEHLVKPVRALELKAVLSR